MAALTQGPTGQSDGTPPRQAAEGTLGLSRVTALIGSIIGVGILNLPGSLAESARSACSRWR